MASYTAWKPERYVYSILNKKNAIILIGGRDARDAHLSMLGSDMDGSCNFNTHASMATAAGWLGASCSNMIHASRKQMDL